MPVPMLKVLAKKSGKSLADAEKYWEEAKIDASKRFMKKNNRYWAYVTGIVKRRMGLAESISFKRFLNETLMSSQEKFADQTYKTLLQLKKDCQQFLKESDGSPLFRGSRSEKKFKKYETLNYRSPTDSSNLDTILFNAYIEDIWNIKNIRSQNCLFTTGDPEHAAYYGEVYLVFPCDKYKYIWSKKVTDLYDTWGWPRTVPGYKPNGKLANTLSELTVTMSKDGVLSKMPTLDDLVTKYAKHFNAIKDQLYNSIEELDYQVTELKAGLDSDNEIIFQTKQYYSISADDMMEYLYIVTDKSKLKSATNLNKMYKLFLEKINEI